MYMTAPKNDNIISSIFHSYINGEIEGVSALTCDDLQTAYANLDKFIEKHNMSKSEYNGIDTDIISEATYVSEYKGFTNGFKLAVRLILETHNT